MPFKSQAQRAWMYSNHPAMAKKWEAHTPKGKKLPKKVEHGFYGHLTHQSMQYQEDNVTCIGDGFDDAAFPKTPKTDKFEHQNRNFI